MALIAPAGVKTPGRSGGRRSLSRDYPVAEDSLSVAARPAANLKLSQLYVDLGSSVRDGPTCEYQSAFAPLGKGDICGDYS